MKLNLLQKELKNIKADYALFLTHETLEPNFTYFTQLTVSHSTLLIPSSGKPTLLTSHLEAEKAEKGKIKNITILNQPLFSYLKKEFPTSKIALDFNYINLNHQQKLSQNFPEAKLENVHPFLSQLRVQKTRQELSYIKQACTITDQAFNYIIKNFDFKTEAELKAALNHQIEKRGAEPAFPTIVASSSNASIPHHSPTNRKLSSFCVIDFGARYKNYCSDCTRTIHIGKPSKR